ncbi:hypothetical protein SOI81_02665 [Acinetobacter pittii]|uniref:hypothetical protein n=1 Tax=Acinetobacter pittii TaxID=48296 RepID=UPI002A6ACFDB|nr:hypothetical protein [Acinetobacter pittii]WPP70581.1 hypothetical protein SOI81_02665 [Acinetobacter pittii]
MQINFLCFHTCKNENSKEYILQNAPFHSDPTATQWLGQGYYLWTDSDYFAHEWGKYPPRNGKYAITKFDFVLDNDEVFLDLVGNVEDQLAFRDLVAIYRDGLQSVIDKCSDVDKQKTARKKLSELCVSTVINFFLSKRKFPYIAVKAQDIDSRETDKLRFVLSGKGNNSSLFYPTRQQIVVYEDGKTVLKNKVLHHIQ